MSSPSHRRPGFSRRAQYALFSGYVVAVVGAIAALFIVAMTRFDPNGLGRVREIATDIGAPVMAIGSNIGRVPDVMDHVVDDYVNAINTNRALRQELDVAHNKLIDSRMVDAQNRELRALLKLQQQQPHVVATARLIGSSITINRRIGIVQAGRSQGVLPSQPVRSVKGLIGRVLNAGQYASRILLLSDTTSVVPIRIVRDGSAGFATGNGDGTLDVRGLNAGANSFHRGDLLMTSGAGGLYPPNIPVAVVVTARGDTATAYPVANPAVVDFVMVLNRYDAGQPADPLQTPSGIDVGIAPPQGTAPTGPQPQPSASVARR